MTAMPSPVCVSDGISRIVGGGCVALLATVGVACAASAAESVPGFAEFLAEKGIDRAGREVIEAATVWDDAVQQAAVRVLLRLAAPTELVAAWRADAVPFGAEPPAVADRLVAIRGRAVHVAPQPLTADQRELAAGRTHYDVVRIVDAAGLAADALVLDAPRAWPRGRPIDEPAVAFGLPLTTGVGPRPEAGSGWPAASPAVVVAAPAVAWTPATPLGALGVDYALFDTVVDGRKLEPGDAEAFFALLSAAGRMPAEPAGAPIDIVPLIDPARKWFATHRGDEVVIAGDARRATRIAIDEPARRAQIGADHYWELFVFVPTPPLDIDGTITDRFPVVCCVRELPAGMPSGDQISEAVTVAGYALKRYGYPLADAVIGDDVRKGARLEAPLVIGRRAAWRPRPATGTANELVFGVFAALAALVAGAIAWNAWAMRRDAQRAAARARAELPDRFTLPGDSD